MTSNTPETQELLPVTQLAREAVAKQVEEAFYDECEYAQELRQGMHDSDPNLQHFARFERDILARQSSNAAERGAVDERALRWIKHNLRLAEQMMKASVKQGNGYANFAAHDAHHALSVALAALTPSALSGDAGENYRDCVEAALAPARQWWGGGKHGDDHIYLINNMMADLRIFHAPKASAQGWQPIETCPDEDLFIGAVHVTDNRTGAKWWDRHLLALDDETGAIHADYDHGWELANYEWWHPLTLPPIPAALPSHQGAGEP